MLKIYESYENFSTLLQRMKTIHKWWLCIWIYLQFNSKSLYSNIQMHYASTSLWFKDKKHNELQVLPNTTWVPTATSACIIYQMWGYNEDCDLEPNIQFQVFISRMASFLRSILQANGPHKILHLGCYDNLFPSGPFSQRMLAMGLSFLSLSKSSRDFYYVLISSSFRPPDPWVLVSCSHYVLTGTTPCFLFINGGVPQGYSLGNHTFYISHYKISFT